MIPLDAADIRQCCGPGSTEAGRRYHQEARLLRFTRDGDLIRATVQGSARHPYRQTIVLSERHGRIAVDGRCSCPVGFNCKHVATVLFHAVALSSATGSDERRLARLLGSPAHPSGPATGSSAPADPGLPPALQTWLDDLARAADTALEDYPPDLTQRLIYVLAPIPDPPRMAQIGVQPFSARLRKDGAFAANSRPYTGFGTPSGAAARYIRPSDARILRDLAQLPTALPSLRRLSDELGAEVLERILGTGRSRWLAVDGPVLRPGPLRKSHLSWVDTGTGSLVPRIDDDEPPAAVLLAATPPLYVDPAAGLLGPLDIGLPPRVTAALMRAPPLAATTLAALNEKLALRMPALAGITPPTPLRERRTGIAPVPCLRVFTAPLPVEADDAAFGYYRPVPVATEPVALARLAFRYGDVTTPLGETRTTVTRFAAGRLVELDRDPAAEAAAVRLLLSHGFEPLSELRRGVASDHARDLVPGDDPLDWLTALHDTVPLLAAAGWEVEVAPDFPYRLLRADGAFEADLREGSGIDWLELHLGITVAGERIDLVDPLVALIAAPGFSLDAFDATGGEADADETVFVPLPDGRVLGVPLARLRPILEALQALAFGSEQRDGGLRLTLRDAARLADFEAATAAAMMAWRGGEAIRALGRRLGRAGGIPPVTIPPSFQAVLRPYQAEGVAWLSLLREVGLGGVLADDMGLGKTVQALAFLMVEKAAGRLDRPALVVAPTSLMSNWAREAERFAPDLRVLVLHGLARRASFDAIPDHDLVLTTYPLMARDHAVLGTQAWSVLLLDEAQTIKNPEATTTKLIGSIEAAHRICLTGTPVENNLGELWSLMSFACPGLLGDRKGFTTLWRTPIEKAGDGERARRLAQRVRPFLLRRTKDAVARDLPPRTDMVERVELTPGQRDVYDAIRLSMHARIRAVIAEKGWARSRIVVLDALLKLREACCDPRLLKLRAGRSTSRAGSAKLDRLDALLPELLAAGRRVIVFSQFTSMLDLIRTRLEGAGIPYALLTGSTRDRPGAITAFDAGHADVFLVSLKAGGVGLNLVSADTVILYDPWWNPAVEAQAVDRIHRIGQTRPVFVHKLVAAGTIEEKMEEMKTKKAALAAALFDPDGTPTLALTEADIEMLLAP